MVIKKAGKDEIDLLTENRMEFVSLIRDISNKDEFKENTRKYLKNYIEKDNLISYIAMEQEKIVSSCILCIYETLPTPSCINGKSGLLLNVYTLEGYRRKGLAIKLLEKLIQDAKALGVDKILLDYTDDGYGLYKKLGFEELDRQMRLKL